MMKSALGQGQLQLEILDLIDAEAPFSEATLDGCNCVFKIDDMCTKRMSHRCDLLYCYDVPR